MILKLRRLNFKIETYRNCSNMATVNSFAIKGRFFSVILLNWNYYVLKWLLLRGVVNIKSYEKV